MPKARVQTLIIIQSDYLTLDEYDKAPDADEDRGQSFEAACAQDLITRIRKIVTSIQYSWQRRDALAIWIETGTRVDCSY